MSDVDFGIAASGKLRAFLLLTLAVFLTALGIGVIGAPMNMQPVLGFLLKAFIGLVFGGIAATCVWTAIRMVRNGPSLPSEVLARCLTCGERTPHDLVCPVCGELPQNRAALLRAEEDAFVGEVFGALILTGVGCLGIFIMIGPYLDGERRWWALIAFFALGLLMFTVGAAGMVGFALTLWNRIKGARAITFFCQGPDRSTAGSGKIAWGKLVGLRGVGQIHVPLANRGRREGSYRVSPGDTALAEMIATLDAAGFFELMDVTVHHWCVGDPTGKTRSSSGEFNRKTERSVQIKVSGVVFPFVEDDDDESMAEPAPVETQDFRDQVIHRYLSRYFVFTNGTIALHEFQSRVDADPVHRSQLEMHARSLRDRGIIVSDVLIEAIAEALFQEKPAQA